MRRRNFVRRGGPRRPANLQWSDVSQSWTFSAVTVTSAVVLVQLQSPGTLSNLTSDPPEDLTILRLVGDFKVDQTVVGSNWTLALTVADVSWTPGANMLTDNDKRILWQMSYTGMDATSTSWSPPGVFMVNGGTALPVAWPNGQTHIDISPKVKVEAGKALYLVAYENAGAGAFTTSSLSMRVLYKRSGRR